MRSVKILMVGILSISVLSACKSARFDWKGKKKSKSNEEVVSKPDDLGPQSGDTGQVPAPPDVNQPIPQGFTITATPSTQEIGKAIVFRGQGCDTSNIKWLYGDGMSGTGVENSYVYKLKGTFKVEATCTKADGQNSVAQTTVYIIPLGSNGPVPPGGGANQNANQSPNGAVQY